MIAAPLIVLAFHAGGFFQGDPALVEPACEVPRAQGVRCIAVEYPLGDMDAAFRRARQVARHHRGAAVLAYGESAGGVLAARLAHDGLAAASASVASPLDLAAFEHPLGAELWRLAGASMADRRRWAVTTRPASPMRLFDSREDPIVPWTFNEAYVARWGNVTRRRAYGYHSHIDLEVRGRAMRWLLARATV